MGIKVEVYQELKAENERLRVALHAAIVTPKGIVPKAAEEFFDQNHPALTEHEWRGWEVITFPCECGRELAARRGEYPRGCERADCHWKTPGTD